MPYEGQTVLVVDDEEGVRTLLKQALTSLGCRTITAADGNEALDLLAKHNVDVMLLDVRMPGLSGIDVLQIVRHSYRSTAVIMMTGVPDAIATVYALKETGKGPHDFIAKPFAIADLLSLVEKTLARGTPAPHALGAELVPV